MNLIIVLPYYIIWHYGKAFSDIWKNWKKFLVFIFNFFSIKILFLTLLSPWRRLGEENQRKANLEEEAENFVTNIMMRIVGAFIRLLFIFLGLLSWVLTSVLGIIFFAVWILLPVALIYLIIYAISGFLK